MEKSNDFELNVGDFIKIGLSGHIGEVLALRKTSNYRGDATYHLGYTSSDANTGVDVALYRSIDKGALYSRVQLGLADLAFTDAASVPASKYGDAYALAECLLDDAVGVGYSSGVWNFLGSSKVAGQDSVYRFARNAAVVHAPAKDGSMISLYLNAKDRKRERRTTMKAGRAFRHMLSTLTNDQIASITEEWIENTAPRNFTLKVGGERKDFRRAYCGIRAAYRNPKTTSYRKSLATSCMHTVKVDGDRCERISPAEVFATGDFKIAWLETDAGEIAGRVVFSNSEDNATSAPVYGACEQSLDMLEAYMSELGVAEGEDWEGLRLLSIDTHHGQVGPYLDCDLRGEVAGDYITLSCNGDIAFVNTNGYTDAGISCDHCGTSVSEDEVYHTDDSCLCDYCFNESYVFLDDGDICPIEDAVAAYTCNSWLGRVRATCIWVRLDEAAWCELLQEFWLADEVEMSECGECIPVHLVGDFPELFPVDDEEEEVTKEEAA